MIYKDNGRIDAQETLADIGRRIGPAQALENIYRGLSDDIDKLSDAEIAAECIYLSLPNRNSGASIGSIREYMKCRLKGSLKIR